MHDTNNNIMFCFILFDMSIDATMNDASMRPLTYINITSTIIMTTMNDIQMRPLTYINITSTIIMTTIMIFK